jgi:MFS family permease
VSRDAAATASGALIFSFALAVALVGLPLLALAEGYSAQQVGLLVASSALAQLLTRSTLAMVMRRLGDWVLVAAASLTLAASCGLVAMSAAVVPFVAGELLQGVSRACFWTGSQVHVVRGGGRAVRALAMVQAFAAAGSLGGPALAGGLIERTSPQAALAAAAAVALAGVGPGLLLRRWPPFSPPADRPSVRIWRRPGVDAGAWAGVSAGAWRGLLGSYIPVVLEAARQTPSTIGTLVSVANGAALVGSSAVGWVRARANRYTFAAGVLAAGAGTAVTGVAAGSAVVAGAALALSGLGAGAIQTLGTAIASNAVHPEERGEAIAATGTFRAAALMVAPIGIAGALGVLTLTAALGVAGVLIAAPVLATRRVDPHPGAQAPT